MYIVYWYIFNAWHFNLKYFFLHKFCWEKLKLVLFPWIRMENLWIQDPDSYINSYVSASLLVTQSH